MNLFNSPVLADILMVSTVVVLGSISATAQVKLPHQAIAPSKPFLVSQEVAPIFAPPVESLQEPAATVSLPDGKVTISLVNQTGTEVVYSVLGDKNQWRLEADTTERLQQLKTPANLSFYRPDRGAIEVTFETSRLGELQVIFQRGTSFDVDRTALTVQETGQVFLN